MYFKNQLLQLICFVLFAVATVNFASAQTQNIKSLKIDNGGGSAAPTALWLKSPFSGAALTDSLLTWNSTDSTVRKIPTMADWRVFGSTATPSKNGLPANNTDSQYVTGRVAIGTSTPATVANTTSGSTAAQRTAYLTLAGGDASLNGVTAGLGGGQVATNTTLGKQALYNNTTGSKNTIICDSAAIGNTTGSMNTIICDSAVGSNVALTGNENVVIGRKAMWGTNNLPGGNTRNHNGYNLTGRSPAGNIGISSLPNNNYALTVGNGTSGSAYFNGTITASSSTILVPSDRRIKTDVETFTDGLNVISQLKPVSFRYNEKSGYSSAEQQKKHVGFIAQDVEKVAPYMVNTIDDSKGASGLPDKRVLDMGALNQVLVNAVQEQQKEIEKQQAEIDLLKQELEELKKAINK